MRADGNPYKDYCEGCLDTEHSEEVGQPHGFFEPLSPNMIMLRATVIFAISMGLIFAGIAAI